MGNKVSDIKETRTVTAGIIKNEDKKKTNRIKTSKYSIITFIPKNLIEQFRRLANFYFLVVTFISIIIDSPVNPMTSLLPLAFVIIVTMAKQGYEDWLRHRMDNTVNNKSVSVIRNSTLQPIKSWQITPGELIKISRDSDLPCDAVLLWSSDSRGKCFVTTANLDGETSLKPIKVPSNLSDTIMENTLVRDIEIEFIPPENDIYTFHGKVSVKDKHPTAIGTDNLLLRGSRIKNTEWVIGCAIYTGEETKLALNSKFTSNKFTSSESNINNFLIFLIVLMIVEILISYLLKRYYEIKYPEHKQYLGALVKPNSFLSIAQDMLSFLLIYYYTIPISLYVTIEMHKFIGSKFFEWDKDLYCIETNQTPLVNSSDLNEELGQIEILFSDKTGTLTKNDMYFQMCTINGVIYVEENKKLYELNEEYCRGEMVETVNTLNPDIELFFTILALCHTVQIEEKSMDSSTKMSNGKATHLQNDPDIPTYQAMSSDEIAFVKAAANRKIIFIGDDSNKLNLKKANGNIVTYEKLQCIEFTSVRRRMSIIVRDPSGKIYLYCKGAESAIFPLCHDSSTLLTIDEHVQYFAEQGLRTLVVGYKELTEEEYIKINDEMIGFGVDLNKRRNETNDDHWRQFEEGLILLGATAVEDRLQDNVTETLEALREAGVQIWVLTGDKIETAINVAQSCGHIPSHSEKLFLTNIITSEDLEPCLKHCIEAAKTVNQAHLTLVVDGQSLQLIFSSPNVDNFIELSLKCEAVICCRLSPLQKAQVIKLVKKSPNKPITAAVGDGANDISMIQEAHVGFGIFGKEGRQAARAADFSFAKFDMLKKVFLVHGHWYYERLATLILYSIYKNVILVDLLIFFQINSVFSTQSLLDSYFLSFYNLFFVSAPILALSLTEHCHTEDELLSNPTLYKKQTRHRLLSWRYFFGWCLLAVYHSVIIYYFCYILWTNTIYVDGKASGLWCFGTILFHCLVVVVNLKLWLYSRYQTYILIALVVLSIIFFMVLTFVYSITNFLVDGDTLYVYVRLLSSPAFWFVNFVIVVACFIPDFLYKIYKALSKNKMRQKPIDNTLEMTQM